MGLDAILPRMSRFVFPVFLALVLEACSLPGRASPQPLGPVPTRQQLEWQALGRCAFAHFGVDTFSDAEWGTGSEPESLFDPTDFSASTFRWDAP